MLAIALQSGSNGNCIFVEAGGVRLLLDAGISGLQAERRLAAFGRDIRKVHGLIISHDHRDHIQCAGVFQRKFHIPLFATEKTLAAGRGSLGKLTDLRTFRRGQKLLFGDVAVETIPTPHDGADGSAFVIDDGRRRLGIFTDLGHVFAGLKEAMASVDAAMLESNYDPEMLANGPYPYFLQQRILGPGGHISNAESAELVRQCAGTRLKWLCLAHLSEQNNTPKLALATHRKRHGSRWPLHVASRYEATGPFEV